MAGNIEEGVKKESSDFMALYKSVFNILTSVLMNYWCLLQVTETE